MGWSINERADDMEAEKALGFKVEPGMRTQDEERLKKWRADRKAVDRGRTIKPTGKPKN